ARPASSIGAARLTAVLIASKKNPVTNSGVIILVIGCWLFVIGYSLFANCQTLSIERIPSFVNRHSSFVIPFTQTPSPNCPPASTSHRPE
ncbi:MAG: hypothetical protein QNJ58_18760, partial [Desulfobacterales bacterium]|nr:hypothetical protein [Desulfobacterales bacterium]